MLINTKKVCILSIRINTQFTLHQTAKGVIQAFTLEYSSTRNEPFALSGAVDPLSQQPFSIRVNNNKVQ
ncbi:hypothetical protein L861_02270 [Litchfieldella anticariensis FP35 = DSM 16096]|uniref:Uncharacterized protein n=1 Tax=Litchfieldella anticariensis (strain DSM 16096 / CECT 5854 / CIP 108499 / LMG 22089 / FP35) TaxID=1121939 RepID=S2KPY7_LITA3|nr:hypothetical protein L861_02270 [Halomonas anticariensis FP35 = DSM 16096]